MGFPSAGGAPARRGGKSISSALSLERNFCNVIKLSKHLELVTDSFGLHLPIFILDRLLTQKAYCLWHKNRPHHFDKASWKLRAGDRVPFDYAQDKLLTQSGSIIFFSNKKASSSDEASWNLERETGFPSTTLRINFSPSPVLLSFSAIKKPHRMMRLPET